ncbi:MAG: hypothetical protein HPPSJP_4330 [Candidatus Hepatoplasma scabrum]|nr:MAG: hypothetical protein HPPSJP_4330 [Candidatus Hepatoplasma sp.]
MIEFNFLYYNLFMNYDILTDQQLLEQLIARKIPFVQDKTNRQEMIDLLKADDLKNPQRVQNNFEQYNHQQTVFQVEVSTVTKIGAVINIFFGIFFSLFIFTLIYTIPCIYFNFVVLRGNVKYKIAAGIFGLFCSLIGGILVLVG